MPDEDILSRVSALIEEEHRLREQPQGERVDKDRLAHVEEELDQCWDLLRQRRAKRQYAEDPSQARVRPASTVESYQQ